jgi:hypothetical protein
MSVLAGHSGNRPVGDDRGLLVVSSCQIATGAGLTSAGMPARTLLILTGLSTLGIAATPQPATGPTSRHLAFAVGCVVTTAVWPALVATRGPAQSWILSVCGCAAVTVVFAGSSRSPCGAPEAGASPGSGLGTAGSRTAARLVSSVGRPARPTGNPARSPSGLVASEAERHAGHVHVPLLAQPSARTGQDRQSAEGRVGRQRQDEGGCQLPS